jgi:hypothetical protein
MKPFEEQMKEKAFRAVDRVDGCILIKDALRIMRKCAKKFYETGFRDACDWNPPRGVKEILRAKRGKGKG